MKLKLLFSVLAFSLASFLYAAERESIVAVSADGDKTTYALATVSRINVIADANSASMTIVDKDGNEFAGYVKILFAEKETSIEELGFTQVYVFPNPVVNTLTIQGVDENTPLESGMLSKTIEGAQKKKEGMNFAIRKNVLQYDDVMNKQRELIYAQRNKVLDGEDIRDTIMRMIDETIDSYCSIYLADDAVHDNWDLAGLRKYFLGWITTPEDLHFDAQQLGDTSKEEVAKMLKEKAPVN